MPLPPETQAQLQCAAFGQAARARSRRIGNLPPQTRLYVLLALLAAGIFGAFLSEPLAQSPAYHHFADARTLCAIPNFWNVVSNLPFLVFGLLGLGQIAFKRPQGMFLALTLAYLVFYTGIFFTGFGSAYYHLNPSNETLFWDRLPMTVAFMAFFSIVVGEFISLPAARKLLLPLLLTGIASVVYWHFSEKNGHGDLRFYLLVQFLPIVLIPLILLLFRRKTDTNFYPWLVIFTYLVAKLFETYDHQFFALTGHLSGHTVKHLAAALAPFLFLLGLLRRKITQAPEA